MSWPIVEGTKSLSSGFAEVALLVISASFGGGVSASLSTWSDVYAKVTYTTDIDGNYQSSVTAKLGFRFIW